MEEDLQSKTSKYITFIKSNKYTIYFLGAIILLLIMVITMIVITVNHTSNNASVMPTPTTQASQSPSVPSSPSTPSSMPSVSSSIITTPDPTEAAEIENQTQPQITPAATYTYSNIKIFGGNWGTMQIDSSTVGGGAVIMQNVNGAWKVVAAGNILPSPGVSIY